MANKYWAVCYGHVCRWAQADSPQMAAQQAFGTSPARCTIRQFPSNPKYLPLRQRTPFLEELYKRHEEKTGVKVG